MSVFFSIVLNLVFCIEVDLLVKNYDRDATGHLLMHEVTKGRILEIL